MYFSPFTPLRYAIEAGLLASLTMSGLSGAIQTYNQNKPTTPKRTEVVTQTEEPEEKQNDTSGTILTGTIKAMATPTPKPTSTPTATPKEEPKQSENKKSSHSSSDTQKNYQAPQQPRVRQQPVHPQAPKPIQQKPRTVTPVAPAAPSQPQQSTSDDDDAAWEAQRNSNPNNQQKDGDLNYEGGYSAGSVY